MIILNIEWHTRNGAQGFYAFLFLVFFYCLHLINPTNNLVPHIPSLLLYFLFCKVPFVSLWNKFGILPRGPPFCSQIKHHTNNFSSFWPGHILK